MIEALNLDGEAWQIVWPGYVEDYVPGASEPYVHVHVAKLSPSALSPLDDYSVTSERNIVRVRAGLYPALQMGSVWKHGKCIWYPQETPPEPFRVNTDRIYTASRSLMLIDGDNRFPVPPDPEAMRLFGDKPDIDCESLIVCPVTQNGCEYLLIPRPELMHAYYTPSALTTRCVFENSMSEAIFESESGPQEDGIVKVSLRKNASQGEAWMIARYLADPVMQTQVDHFRRIGVTNRINSANAQTASKKLRSVHIGFPFYGTTDLVVAGKYVTLESTPERWQPSRTIQAYLAYRIIRCTYPMPFRDVLLSLECDSRQGKNHDDPELKDSGWGRGPSIAIDPSASEVSINLDPEIEPSRGMHKYVIESFTERFPELIGKEFLREEKQRQEYKHVKGPWPTLIQASKGATGSGKSRASTTAQTELRPGPSFPTRRMTEQWEVEDFIDTVVALRTALEAEGLTIATQTQFGRGYSISPRDQISCFPRSVGRCRSWHLIGDGKARPRRIVIACVTGRDRTLYLLELERKTTSCKSYGVCLLHTDGFEPIADSELERFIELIAVCNGWPDPNKMKTLHRRYVDHPSTVQVTDLAKRIYKAIHKVR